MENLLLSPVPLLALKEEIREIIRQELAFIHQKNEPDRLLSAAEACRIFDPKVCKATLVNWAKKGGLQQHRIGRRVFYKHSEIVASLQTLKKYKQL